MIQFRNPSDSKSVELVDPNNLAKSFGTGTKLKSVTVQITDEPVTSGIQKRLGWLPTMEIHDFKKDGPFDAKYPAILVGLRKNKK